MREAVRDPVFHLALLLGALVRLVPAVSSDFPINDGGLFATYIEQLADAGLSAPPFLSYNGTEIPFAYPPVAFYLGAGLAGLGVPTTEVLRWLPPLLATLTVPVWYLLARELCGRSVGSVAAVVFALVPRAYDWLVAGGGLTRSLGLLLVLVGLYLSVRYFRGHALWTGIVAGLALGLGALSHPEAAVVSVVTVLLLRWVVEGPWRRLALVAVIASATVLPWLVVTIATHGLTPLIDASASRRDSFARVVVDTMTLNLTHEVLAPIAAVFGAVGAFVAATSKRSWVILWVAVIIVVAPAAAPTFVMLPWSVLTALTYTDVLVPRFARRGQRLAVATGLTAMVLVSLWTPYLPNSPLWYVGQQARQAMAWITENVSPGTDVAVITGAYWARDATAEWFPYLTATTSVGTVQGQEFTGSWDRALDVNAELAACAAGTVRCVESVSEAYSLGVELIFVPKEPQPGQPNRDCCVSLRESLRAAATVIYDGPGATVAAMELPEP